jgi:molybdopterin-guanine dinucleotide biosynthesis protein A
MTFDAIVLAGGEGRRLGGISKPAIKFGGRRLLDIVLDAVTGAQTAVVVGATMPTARPVTWTREEPPGGGPVAGLAAALPLVSAVTIVVLAADLPFITAAAVAALVQARGDAAAALAIDETGREQPLIGCYDRSSLIAALPANPHGASMRSLLKQLAGIGTVKRLDLGGDPPVVLDCDTAADLSRAQELA